MPQHADRFAATLGNRRGVAPLKLTPDMLMADAQLRAICAQSKYKEARAIVDEAQDRGLADVEAEVAFLEARKERRDAFAAAVEMGIGWESLDDCAQDVLRGVAKEVTRPGAGRSVPPAAPAGVGHPLVEHVEQRGHLGGRG